MSSVIFIRHGESLANVDTGYYKHPDCAIILTQKGVDQCLELSTKMDSFIDDDRYGTYTTVIASRMLRTQLTANIVMSKAQHKLPITIDARINETRHSLDGIADESNELVIARVRSLIEQNHCNLIIFTHGMLMGTVDPEKGYAYNCELRKYDREDLLNNYLK